MRWDAYTVNFLTFKVIECHWYIKINVTYTLKNRYENKISCIYSCYSNFTIFDANNKDGGVLTI
jgi:hypothetical protein